MTVLRNCKFLDFLTECTELSEGDVLLDSGKILSIGALGSDFGEISEEYDMEGRTLLPGLIDMHVHLIMSDNNFKAAEKEADQTINCLLYAQTMLDMGFTTVRDCGDSHAWATVSLANAIEAGKLVGPTIIPCGPILCPTAANTSAFILDNIDGTDSVRRMSRLAIRKGARFLKLYGSASMNSPLGEPGLPIIEPDEIREAVQVAKRYGTYVAIHCHGEEAIDNAVKSGVHTVEHASLIGERTLRYIDENRSDFGVVPTLSVIYGTASPERTDVIAVRARRLFGTICECLQNAYRHGVRMGYGRDVTMKSYIEHPELEFKLRSEELKFSNVDILKQATIDSAILMGLDHEIGSIRVGKRADLIAVDGNPAEDITVMYKKPAHVFKNGVCIR